MLLLRNIDRSGTHHGKSANRCETSGKIMEVRTVVSVKSQVQWRIQT